ncbi:hypothetical protein M407DRAFT_242480 [Tulasnella calospora MUT 4182]|uniref:Uncharacterized protein n=1 Tax=Tulasnella calospora MUT 4182 TaxID=1051891 RepID=A0A0C3L7J0_9AGAM|nr:hypothetical protein M407DRAFT_242480 [Tulasnella calospora MUT 4182]
MILRQYLRKYETSFVFDETVRVHGVPRRLRLPTLLVLKEPTRYEFVSAKAPG